MHVLRVFIQSIRIDARILMSARLTMVGVIKHASISKDHSNVDVMKGMNYHLIMIDFVLILMSVTILQALQNVHRSASTRKDRIGVNVIRVISLMREMRRYVLMKMSAW